jgi:hypothetical protein
LRSAPRCWWSPSQPQLLSSLQAERAKPSRRARHETGRVADAIHRRGIDRQRNVRRRGRPSVSPRIERVPAENFW